MNSVPDSVSDAFANTDSPSADLALFFTLSADVMCILDGDGHCLQVNPAFERLLGYGHAAMRDRTLPSLAHPSDRVATQTAIDQLRLGIADSADFATTTTTTTNRARAIAHFTNRSIGADDHWHRLDWTISAVDLSAGDVPTDTRRLYCVARQVASPQLASPLAIDSNPDIQQSNRTLEDRVAARTQQLTTAQERYLELLATERQTHSRAEKSKAEARLYADAVKNMQVGLHIWQLKDLDDVNSLELIATNPAAGEFVGMSMEGTLGKTLPEIFPALVETDIPQTYANVVRTGEPYDLGEIPYADEHPNTQGEQRFFAVKAFPLANHCVGVAFEDITASKQAALDLQRYTDDLLTVNQLLTDAMSLLEQRNQELDQFAYVTSHDLKAPLRAIANLATWIEEDLGSSLPPENVEQFDLLKNRVHRMEGLINGLLEYSRIGRIQQSYERIDVKELLDDILDSLSPPSAFTVEIEPDMPILQSQKLLLTQVFSNLISNAIKHHDRADGRVQISVRERGKFYEFCIADDGPGIDPDYHQKIFTIFQTLQSRDDFESTGIGLSIVQKVVRAEGGEIMLSSQVGEGSKFRFTWPKSPPNRDTAAAIR